MTLPPPRLTSPLDFRCTSCGNCCRNLRVAITARDLTRLLRATQRGPGDLVAFLAPDEVDMTGEPASFIELGVGRRLMVLAQEQGACRLLGPDDRCGSYEARPRDCRAFPFDFGLPRATPGARRLRLLPLDGCDYAQGGAHQERELRDADAERWAELSEYQAFVARWNRRAYHRRRLGRGVGTAAQFLDYALGAPAHGAASNTGLLGD